MSLIEKTAWAIAILFGSTLAFAFINPSPHAWRVVQVTFLCASLAAFFGMGLEARIRK